MLGLFGWQFFSWFANVKPFSTDIPLSLFLLSPLCLSWLNVSVSQDLDHSPSSLSTASTPEMLMTGGSTYVVHTSMQSVACFLHSGLGFVVAQMSAHSLK